MLALFRSKRYIKAIKKYSKSPSFQIERLEAVVKVIQNGEVFDRKHKDHELRGDFQGIRECHIESDLLLLYQIDKENKTLFLINMGSHSELSK